jgi:hypothetical protein
LLSLDLLFLLNKYQTAEQERTQHLDEINLEDHSSNEDMEITGGTVGR